APARPERLARRVHPGLPGRGVAPSPAGGGGPSRPWRDRAAAARVVWGRGPDVRPHEPALCGPPSGRPPPLPPGAPGGGAAPEGTSRRGHHRANEDTAARSAPGGQPPRLWRVRVAATAPSRSPTTPPTNTPHPPP